MTQNKSMWDIFTNNLYFFSALLDINLQPWKSIPRIIYVYPPPPFFIMSCNMIQQMQFLSSAYFSFSNLLKSLN